MAMTLSLDLDGATVADLEAVLAAARAGGIGKHAPVTLDGTVLTLNISAPSTTQAPAANPTPTGGAHPVGEAAIRSVIDILTGRQSPQV